MKLRIFELFDITLLVCILILISFGVVFIYSSGINSSGISVSNEYIKQIVFAGTGLVLMAAAAILDYRKIARQSPKLFTGLVFVLLYTCLFGRYVNGARSWLGIGDLGVQPSEFGKILYIFFLAWYLERSDMVSPRKRFFTATGIMLVPLLLILLQPDLGTASVYIPIYLIMCFMAGIPIRYLLMVFSAGMLTIICTVLPVWETEILQRTLPWMRLFTDNRLRFIMIASVGTIALIGTLGYTIFKNK